MSYEDKTFRLLRVFRAEQKAEAHESWRKLTEHEGKLCVLLEERFRYSLWQQVQIDLGFFATDCTRGLRQSLCSDDSVAA